MRIRRSDGSGPGILRVRRGRGFSYRWSDGRRVEEPEVLERISALVLPPAWNNVWICPWPNGHIQAIGTDAAGRRQYRYHDEWRRRRDAEKFERILEFGSSLPVLRAKVRELLDADGLGRDRVLAAAVRLLELGCFRIGGEEYAEEHETFGLATLRRDHVTRHGDVLHFHYVAKSQKDRSVVVRDPAVASVITALRRRRDPGEGLLAWRDGHRWVDVRSEDINAFIKDLIGTAYSAKDFRTWSATVLAAVRFAALEPRDGKPSERTIRLELLRVVREVAEVLGNTPSVCRASYIDPRVIDRYLAGETIARVIAELERDAEEELERDTIEGAVLELLGASV
jgi:DNA topoisomerase IB